MSSPNGYSTQRDDDPRRSLDDLISRAIAYHSAPALKELLAFSRNFPYLAPFNVMLLHVQNPGISFALRARQWEKRYRRRISPGARPYVILRMMGPVEFIFDLSDTEPIDPNYDRVPKAAVNPFSTNGKPPFGTLDKMIGRCLKMAVEVSVRDFGTSMAGEVSRNLKRIPPYSILLNSKHTESQQLGTLAHELAHVLCGHLGEDKENKINDRTNLTYEIEEFEAEAVAYLVTDRMNLDIGSVSYLSNYLDSKQEIPGYSLEMVLKVAGRIEMLMTGDRRPGKDKYLTETVESSVREFPDQIPFPIEDIPKFVVLISKYGDLLPRKPDNFARILKELFQWNARRYVDSAWKILKAIDPSVSIDPNWPEVFDRIYIIDRNQRVSEAPDPAPKVQVFKHPDLF